MDETVKRTPATPEQVINRIKDLTVAFPNRDDFFTLSLKYIIPLKLTDAELSVAVENIIGYHRGQLLIADIVDECIRQRNSAIREEEKRNRKLQEKQWREEWKKELRTKS
jgi:hypothetical protein